jgi:Domain of unknown function (DUF4336)
MQLLLLLFPALSLFHFGHPILGLALHEKNGGKHNLIMHEQLQISRRQFANIVSGSSASLLVFGNNGQQSHPPNARAVSGGGEVLANAAAPTSPSTSMPYLMKEYYDVNNIQTAPEAGRFLFPTILPPFTNRATYRYTLGRNAWALEQLLAFQNVTATIRCNFFQLQETGGLWVHSPLYPTGEFCQLLDDIGHPVEHVVLPCNALEHKAPLKAFCQEISRCTSMDIARSIRTIWCMRSIAHVENVKGDGISSR